MSLRRTGLILMSLALLAAASGCTHESRELQDAAEKWPRRLHTRVARLALGADGQHD